MKVKNDTMKNKAQKNEIKSLKIKNNAKNKIKKCRTDTKNKFYYKKDRLNQLRGFCTTVLCGCSATKAGEVLYLQPGTISQQIQTLENTLNITLFDENRKNKLILTEDGQKFFEKTYPILQNLDNVFKNYRKDLEDERKNTLRIASVETVLGRLIKYTMDFKRENSNANISLFNTSLDIAREKLLKDEIDFAIFPVDFIDREIEGLEKIEMAQHKSNLVLFENHPLTNKNDREITRDNIAKYPFGYLPGGLYIKSFQKFLDDYKLKSPIDLGSGTVSLLKEMVRRKMCITCLDRFYISESDKKDFEMKDCTHLFPDIFYYLFYKKGTELKELTKKFIEVIKYNKDGIFI